MKEKEMDSNPEPTVCIPKSLPRAQWVEAARVAAKINPVNQPLMEMAGVFGDLPLEPLHLAVMTTKYWGASGIRLTVGFLDAPSTELKNRILSHMNAWDRTANVRFVETSANPQVRIARLAGDGHWSYLGTDVALISPDRATMNLDSFTMNTPESEFYRVVRHETGHTMGFPHEHMRRQLVARIDAAKAIAYYGRTQGWDAEQVRRQVLTPLADGSIHGTGDADPTSIMCYQIPGSITTDGKPILGGLDINELDYTFAGKIYPKPNPDGAAAAPAKTPRSKPKKPRGKARRGRK